MIIFLQRMDIARAIGDKSSMRRSYTNMGNAYVLLGKHDEAERCYRYMFCYDLFYLRLSLKA